MLRARGACGLARRPGGAHARNARARARVRARTRMRTRTRMHARAHVRERRPQLDGQPERPARQRDHLALLCRADNDGSRPAARARARGTVRASSRATRCVAAGRARRRGARGHLEHGVARRLRGRRHGGGPAAAAKREAAAARRGYQIHPVLLSVTQPSARHIRVQRATSSAALSLYSASPRSDFFRPRRWPSTSPASARRSLRVRAWS